MGCGCNKNRLNEPTVPELVIGREIEISEAVPGETQVREDARDSVQLKQPDSYNILDVIKDKVTNNLIYVEKEEMQERLKICQPCDDHRLGMCTNCGCIIEFKVRYAKSSCPKGLW